MLSSSIILAQYYGIILAIAGLAALLNKKHAISAVNDIKNSAGLQLVSAFIPLLLGTYLVLNHNIWHKDWTVLLTIVGWLLLFSGVMRMLFPRVIQAVAKKCAKGHANTIYCFIVFVVGLGLVYYGFSL